MTVYMYIERLKTSTVSTQNTSHLLFPPFLLRVGGIMRAIFIMMGDIIDGRNCIMKSCDTWKPDMDFK